MKKITVLVTVAALMSSLLTGCSSGATATEETAVSSLSPTTQALSTTVVATDRLSLTTEDAFSASDYEVGYITSTTTSVTLMDGGSSVEGSGAIVSGDIITITAGGTYLLSGSLSNGQIVVDCEEDKVQLVLDGVSISNSSTAPIYVLAADQTYITTDSGSVNTLSATLVEDASAETNVDAVIFSHDDLTLNGQGSLTIVAVDGNGVTSKDDLIVTSGNYTITADKHGLEANDSIRIAGGAFDIVSQKDGLHCENTDDADKGYIFIVNGTFTINAQGDGMDSSAQIQIEHGSFYITAGGGYELVERSTTTSTMQGGIPGRDQMNTTVQRGALSADMTSPTDNQRNQQSVSGMTVDGQMGDNMITTPPESTDRQQMPQMSGQNNMMGGQMTTIEEDDSVSTKGIKADSYLILMDGTYNINSADDALHGNMGLEIWDGVYQLQTGDDAIHSDLDTFIADGTITITACYEGIEGERIEIAGGTINIKSDDDGLNAARGTGSSGDIDILISGGYLFIDCDNEGDGIDSNGTILVTGGTVVIYGTVNTTDTTLDYSGSSYITGGTFIATGSAGQTLQNFGEDSTQGSILVQLSSFTTGDVTLTDSSGNVIAQTSPTKSYQAVIVSSPDIVVGETYTLTAGDYTETIVMESLIYGEGNEHSMGGMSMGGGMPGGMGGR